jgi:hypothetical protein
MQAPGRILPRSSERSSSGSRGTTKSVFTPRSTTCHQPSTNATSGRARSRPRSPPETRSPDSTKLGAAQSVCPQFQGLVMVLGQGEASLERLAWQMDSGRTRLLYLLTSVRVLRPDPADALGRLLEAIDLARSRSQPFETALTLSAAARERGTCCTRRTNCSARPGPRCGVSTPGPRYAKPGWPCPAASRQQQRTSTCRPP